MEITVNNLHTCTPEELEEFLRRYSTRDVPNQAVPLTVTQKLAEYANNSSFIAELFIRAKVAVRAAKRGKIAKDIPNFGVDDLVVKRDILEQSLRNIRGKWDTASRIWTVHTDDISIQGSRSSGSLRGG